jgi:putative hydrolase of the HAD superfamily
MSIRAIFFDLDDTLCHTSGSRRQRAEIAARYLVEHDPRLVAGELVERILEPVSDSGWPRGVNALLEDLGLLETPAGRRAHGAWFFEDCEDLVAAYEGCLDMLGMLSERYILGVITNGPPEIQRRKYDALRVEAHFRPDLFLPSGAIGYHKPDPRIFRHALKLAGVAADEAIMIGDWPEADIVGAQRAGMRGVWFNPEERRAPPGIVPDATISCYADLPALLVRWS